MKKLFVTFLIFVFVLVGATSLIAANQVVTNNNDSGAGSLRQAIIDANSNDEITFNVTGTITLTTGQLAIDKNLTITGPGADQLSINGNANSRIFMIDSDDDEDVVTITGLTITNGSAPYGGGIYNYSDNLTLENCTISGNSASDYDGGGMYNCCSDGGTSSPTLTNCTISGNSAYVGGGGMYNCGDMGTSSPILTNCTISGNSASNYEGDGGGGGIYNDGSGGGNSSPTLTNCTISGNSTSDYDGFGGGICNYGYLGTSSPILTNCTISGNSAGYGGGMDNGGCYGTSSPILTNCTISGNSASNDGGGIYNDGCDGTSSPILTNCIMWSDSATTSGNEVHNYFATPSYSYCDVEGCGGSGGGWVGTFGTDGGNNKDSDPKFANEPNPTSAHQVVADHDLLLTAGSPCLGAGSVPDASGVPSTDKDGRSRPLPAGASNVDMGAFEQYDSDASLPVELSSFTAMQEKGSVILEWRTESEIENLGFLIEKQILGTGCWTEIAGYLSNSALEGQGSVTYKTEYSYTDNAVIPGKTYEYRLGDVDYNGKVTWHGKVEIKVKIEGDKIPAEFGLQKAYPNPFNPAVTLNYGLKEAGQATLQVFNLRGQLVETLVSAYQLSGTYDFTWQPENLGAGVYIIRLRSGRHMNLQKVVLVK